MLSACSSTVSRVKNILFRLLAIPVGLVPLHGDGGGGGGEGPGGHRPLQGEGEGEVGGWEVGEEGRPTVGGG